MVTTPSSQVPPLVDVDQAAEAISGLHHWLLEKGFPSLERYPWPGHFPSLYHDPSILFRFVRGRSNSWQASALSSLYYAWLARSNSDLWLLCQAFMLCQPVESEQLQRLLTRVKCHELLEAGVLSSLDGMYRSLIRVTPWQGRLFWHDAPPGFRDSWVFLGADSVDFARHLAEWVVKHREVRYDRALDLCTGAGIHALMLAGIAGEVVGADINKRAIAFARLNAALNSIPNASFCHADLFNGIPAGTFDLVVSNTPFVFLPDELRPRCRDGDGGAMGIELVLRLVEGLQTHLAPEGVAILHANSPIVKGRDLLLDGLCERLTGGRWQLTLIPTHEFHDASFYQLYAVHKIERFVRYIVILRAGRPFQVERPSLPPWRKAACAVRIASVHAQGTFRLGLDQLR